MTASIKVFDKEPLPIQVKEPVGPAKDKERPKIVKAFKKYNEKELSDDLLDAYK